MKILHVITSLRTGGAEKLMVDLLPKFQNRGIDVELLVFDGIRTPFYEQLESSGVRVIAIRTGGSVYDLRNILYLRKCIDKFDIIHTHNTSPQLFTAFAKAIKFGKGPILVTTEHNTTNRRRNKPYLKFGDVWMYKQYSKVICISKQAEKNLRNYLKEDSDKICTVFNGIEVSRYSNLLEDRRNNGDSVNITMVSAFRDQKDQKTLIKALALLPSKFFLKFVGGGNEQLIQDCKNLVQQLNLSERVSFTGIRTDIPEQLSQADIVVLSSHYEGLSLSSLEGMASGRPFVASDVDGLHEIVAGYGLLFPHEDAKALSEVLLQLGRDKKYAIEVANKCVERAKQFDISIMADQYMDIYNDLLKDTSIL
jgi:glycosyltransferase involved in cell wall biosynthesis